MTSHAPPASGEDIGVMEYATGDLSTSKDPMGQIIDRIISIY